MDERQGHVDLRVQKTKAAIRSTFQAMICEMPAEKITVRELAGRARIHRKTFYLHYPSIEALYQELMEEITAGYYREMERLTPPIPFKEVNRVFFTYYARQAPYVERLICDPSYRSFCNQLHAATLRHNRARHNPYARFSPEAQNLINVFLTANSLELFRQWVADGRKMPLEEVIGLTGILLDEGVSSLLKRFPYSQQ